MPLRVAISLTCPPSPCGRLSRPPTTTGTPSPWGSPPVGDPAFRARTTLRTVAGALFVTLRLATPTQSPGACREWKSKIRSHRIRWRLSLTIMGTIGRKPSCPILSNCSLVTGVHAIQLSPCRPGLGGHAPRMVSEYPAFSNMLLSPLAFAVRLVRRPRGITLNLSQVSQGSSKPQCGALDS